MCIISIKAKGIPMPEEATIRNMFYNNDDGAGYMYAWKNKVYIRKGFMKLSELLESLEKLPAELGISSLKDIAVIMHFRIGTAGGNTPQNTHPFPVNSNIKALTALNYKTDVGVAHNGIIHSVTPRAGISDTMEYIATQMAILKKIDKKFYLKKLYLELMHNAVDSKLAFLDGRGNVTTVGEFITDEETGLQYSNSTYKTRRSSSYYFGHNYNYDLYNSGYNFDGYDDWWTDYENKNKNKEETSIVPLDTIPEDTEGVVIHEAIISPLSAYTDYLVFEDGSYSEVSYDYNYGIDKYGLVYSIDLDYLVATCLSAVAYTYESDDKKPLSEPQIKKFNEADAELYEVLSYDEYFEMLADGDYSYACEDEEENESADITTEEETEEKSVF